MKKAFYVIFVCLLLLGFNQSEAATTYNFDVTGIDYTGLTDAEKIQGVEMTISGTAGVDWNFVGFNGVYASTWFFGGKTGGIIDDTWDGTDIATSVPLNNGTIFTLISPNDSIITASGIIPFDYVSGGQDYTGTFNAQFNVVPIPGSILLLGSGLIGLIGIARRKMS